MSLRVLVVDDHLVVREGLRLILETAGDMECAGEAADGVEAYRKARELKPDVVIMDLRMPGGDGLEAIGKIHTELPGTGIIILTTYNEDELLVKGLRAGARAFLLKDSDRVTILDAVRAASRGEALLKPETVARLLAKTEDTVKTPDADRDRVLTDRELDVLSAAAAGERSKEIARRLGISERTVKAHLSSIFQKLDVDSRTAAVTEAIGRGLLGNRVGNREARRENGRR